jgi:hypothetical protein
LACHNHLDYRLNPAAGRSRIALNLGVAFIRKSPKKGRPTLHSQVIDPTQERTRAFLQRIIEAGRL